MKILKLIVSRLLAGILTMAVVSVLIFSCISLLPGDFASSVLGQSVTPETVAAFRTMIGADVPIWTRYLTWIQGAVVGDFGYSFTAFSDNGINAARSVSNMITDRLFNTLFLAGLTALVAVPLSLVLGVVAALWRGKLVDRTISLICVSAVSLPEFFVGYILIVFLAVKLPIFYSLAYVTPDMGLLERVHRCALPGLTLLIPIMGHMSKTIRSAVASLMNSPYVETARLKGVPYWRVVTAHALPNAWAPISAVIALNLAYLVVGVVVVEVVFVYPGIGQLMVDSVTKRDMPLVLACALIFSLSYVLLNILADVIAIISNPRLLHPR